MTTSLPESLSPDRPTDSELIVVDADHYSRWFDLKELWRYRELIWIFAGRDVKVRYRQTVVGIAWTILQPLTQMVVFTGLFRMLKTEPGGWKTSLSGDQLLWTAVVSVILGNTVRVDRLAWWKIVKW